MAPIEYQDAKYVIPPVASSVLFIFLYNIFANIEFYFEKRKFVLYGSILSAGLNVLLNFIFIPLFGYFAAAYTTLICYILYCAMHAIFSKLICKNNSIPENIFPWRALFLISVMVILLGIIMGVLYKYIILRYTAIVLIFILSVIMLKCC